MDRDSLDNLKERLLSTVLVRLAVIFLLYAVTWGGTINIIGIGVGVALVIAALAYTIRIGKRFEREEESGSDAHPSKSEVPIMTKKMNNKKDKKEKQVAKGANRTQAKLAKSQVAGKDGDAKPKLSRKEYEVELGKLQIELVKMQEWVKTTGAKICVLFEGRDAAGKGGTIKGITEKVSPRVFRVIAMPSPTEREKSQMYIQRYLPHLPAGGEVVLFDRSWYNRAGVERVMGFATEKQVADFLKYVPAFERVISASGVILIKYWLEVSKENQEKRFEERIDDYVKIWKLSPMDLESHRRWYDYSRARDAMFEATDTVESPWHVVDYNDQRRGRLNCIAHLLSQVPYEEVPYEKVKLPKRDKAKGYVEPDYPYRFVPSKY